MKWFKMKFKVRVNYYSSDVYTVEWAEYRIFPIWHPLRYWFGHSFTGGTEGWSIYLFSITEAERLALNIKSKEDIEAIYKAERVKEQDFKRRKREYLKRAIPYTTKEFN